MSIATVLCRHSRRFLVATTQNHSSATPCKFNIRHKSENTESESSITVKKEKKNWKFVPETMNWDNLPAKLNDFKTLFKELLKHPKDQAMRGRHFKQDMILYYFRDAEELENWHVFTDEEIGGKSWAELVLGDNGMTATFRGYCSQRIPRYMLNSKHDKLEEKTTFRGYACMQTMPFRTATNREDFLTIEAFNVFEIRLRGDGRKYFFEMLCDLEFIKNMYTVPVHTRGGPDWEVIQIPYSKLIASKRSTYLHEQSYVAEHRIKNLRFLLLDGIEGPFQLEIDYIALKRDTTVRIEQSDYHDPYKETDQSIGTF